MCSRQSSKLQKTRGGVWEMGRRRGGWHVLRANPSGARPKTVSLHVQGLREDFQEQFDLTQLIYFADQLSRSIHVLCCRPHLAPVYSVPIYFPNLFSTCLVSLCLGMSIVVLAFLLLTSFQASSILFFSAGPAWFPGQVSSGIFAALTSAHLEVVLALFGKVAP